MLEAGLVLQGRYSIERTIAQGGMGAVYLARDLRLQSRVAVKKTLFADRELGEAFEREARLLANLRHSALPKVIDHFIDADGQFLVMEYIAGDDLADQLKTAGGPLPANLVESWASQLLDVLEYLHTRTPPIIHRDIKPKNLKLSERGEIVLLDFGLAKGVPSYVGISGTTSSIFAYTANYAPLEQIEGKRTDARSDLYSLGATLYHLATGVTPVGALTRASAIARGYPDALQSPEQLNVRIRERMAATIVRAMALDPEARPSSAPAMRELLYDHEPPASAAPQIITLGLSGSRPAT